MAGEDGRMVSIFRLPATILQFRSAMESPQ